MPSFSNHREFIPYLDKAWKELVIDTNKRTKNMLECGFIADLQRSGSTMSINGTPLNNFSEFKTFCNATAMPNSAENLFRQIFEKCPNISPERQESYKKFIERYITQEFWNIPGNIYAQQIMLKDMISSGNEYHINIVIPSEDAMYIVISNAFSSICEYKDTDNLDVLKNLSGSSGSYVMQTRTVIKVELVELYAYDVSVISSEVECDDKYKGLFDTRNFIEKIMDWLSRIFMCDKNQKYDINFKRYDFQSVQSDRLIDDDSTLVKTISDTPGTALARSAPVRFFSNQTNVDGKSMEVISDTPTPRPSIAI